MAARGVGEELGDFDHVVASTSPRTMETAIAMGFAVDQLIEMPSPTETGEVAFHSWREWSDPCTALRTKSLASRAVAAYLDEQAHRTTDLLDQVPEGGRVLVVGHGGWIESVIARLVAPEQLPTVGGSFWHLDGIRLSMRSPSSASIAAVERLSRP